MATDPELSRQLDAAKRSGDPVAAVVTLRRTPGEAPDPDDVQARTSAAVAKATEASGSEPDDVRVWGHMASAYVSGSEAFIRELAEQPEIASAVANVPGDSGEPMMGGAADELGTPLDEPAEAAPAAEPPAPRAAVSKRRPTSGRKTKSSKRNRPRDAS